MVADDHLENVQSKITVKFSAVVNFPGESFVFLILSLSATAGARADKPLDVDDLVYANAGNKINRNKVVRLPFASDGCRWCSN